MGGTKSKPKVPTNPFELQQYNREQYELEYQRIEKEEQRKKKAAEKNKRRQERMNSLKTPTAPLVPKKMDFEESDYDLEAKKRMQDQLARDSQTFVLNQLMLSVQFFENYER